MVAQDKIRCERVGGSLIKVTSMLDDYYALLSCKAPRTASWKWRSINKIIIIISCKEDHREKAGVVRTCVNGGRASDEKHVRCTGTKERDEEERSKTY